MLGGLVWPPMFKFLIPVYDFAGAVRWLGLLTAVTCLIMTIIARPNPDQQIRVPEKWRSRRVWYDSLAWKSIAYRWYVASVCFVFFGLYPLFFSLEDWARKYKIAQAEDKAIGLNDTGSVGSMDGLKTFWFLAIMNASSAVGRLSSAFLAHRFGELNIHIGSACGATVLALVLWVLASSAAAALPFVILFGIVSGTLIAMPAACVASFLPNVEQQRLGQWTGMMYTVAAPFVLTGPLIGGALIIQGSSRHSKPFIYIQGFCGASFGISVICMAVAKYYTKHQGDIFNNSFESNTAPCIEKGDTPQSTD